MGILDWLLEFFGKRVTPRQDYAVLEVKPCNKCQGESKCADCGGRGWRPGPTRRRGCVSCFGSGRGSCCIENRRK